MVDQSSVVVVRVLPFRVARTVNVRDTHVQLLKASSYISISCTKTISIGHGMIFVQGINTNSHDARQKVQCERTLMYPPGPVQR